MSKFGLSAQEIQTVFAKRIPPIRSGPFSLICDRSTTGFRYAIAISKQIKSKPAKQKLKRQLRALLYTHPENWPNHFCILVVAPDAAGISFADAQKALEQLSVKIQTKFAQL